MPGSSRLGACSIGQDRTLRSALIGGVAQPRRRLCAQPVLEDVQNATLGLVVTWSSGSNAAKSGYGMLQSLADRLKRSSGGSGGVRAVLDGKGSRCDGRSAPLASWMAAGHGHCIEGPNVGARESHTIWAYCLLFYDHLPRATLFVQDDPHAHSIPTGGVAWIEALEGSYERRRLTGGGDGSGRGGGGGSGRGGGGGGSNHGRGSRGGGVRFFGGGPSADAGPLSSTHAWAPQPHAFSWVVRSRVTNHTPLAACTRIACE